MRGKPFRDWCAGLPSGITPAGAGKTLLLLLCSLLFQDHPRRCGENVYISRICANCAGSPPQVRGKLNRFKPKFNRFRITPAGAGKTCHHFARKRNGWDHPRRCGENRYQHGNIVDLLGSPPQVRGKLTQSSMSILHTGITPAGAGKTVCRCMRQCQYWDHPRRCGENFPTV